MTGFFGAANPAQGGAQGGSTNSAVAALNNRPQISGMMQSILQGAAQMAAQNSQNPQGAPEPTPSPTQAQGQNAPTQGGTQGSAVSLDNAGSGEGTYWKKQTDKVSYDGARPETMKALDLLGQWFYQKTGKPFERMNGFQLFYFPERGFKIVTRPVFEYSKQSGYINKNDAATDAVNNALAAYINQGGAATDSANADLSEYIRNNKNALGTVDRSISGLERGELPTAYQQNMQNAIRTALARTVGDNVNSLAQRGVINSSVTNSALNDIERNAADAVAQQYLQNINTIGNLAQQKFSDYITADQQNAAMTQQKLGNITANIDRGANLEQQRYTNSMGNNATNASLAQQQLQNTLGTNQTNAGLTQQKVQNTLGANSANAGLTQQQFGNTSTAVNANAGLSGQRSNNTQNALNMAANVYGTQYQQSADATKNKTQIAQQQLQNILGSNEQKHSLANSWGSLIQSPITTAASSQEAAQSPATNLWNASLGLNGATTGALAAAAGKGTTTTTSTTSGGGGFLSGLLGAGLSGFTGGWANAMFR